MFKRFADIATGTVARKNEITRYSFTEPLERFKADGKHNEWTHSFCGSLSLTVQRLIEHLLFDGPIPGLLALGKSVNPRLTRDLTAFLGLRLLYLFVQRQQEATRADGLYDEVTKAMLTDAVDAAAIMYSPSERVMKVQAEWLGNVSAMETGQRDPADFSLDFAHAVNEIIGVGDGPLRDHVRNGLMLGSAIQRYLGVLEDCISHPDAANFIKW